MKRIPDRGLLEKAETCLFREHMPRVEELRYRRKSRVGVWNGWWYGIASFLGAESCNISEPEIWSVVSLDGGNSALVIGFSRDQF